MTDTTHTTTETSEVVDTLSETPEGDISDATPDAGAAQGSDLKSDQDDEMFPREYVENLRNENAKYRQRAQESDTLANRLHTELVRATGRLADPSDLPFDEDHLADAGKMVAAIDDLLTAKPHLATRRPVGDIGQGARGPASEPFSLLQMLKERT